MAYSTLGQLKSWLGITATTDDVLLANILDSATAAIDDYCGRWFEARTSTRYYSSDARDNRERLLVLDEDLISISVLTNGDTAATVIPSTEYWLWPRNPGPPYWAIKLESASTYSWQWDVDGWVSVAGVWGYSTTPPASVAQACYRWAGYMYHQRDTPVYDVTVIPEAGVITVPQGMPQDVRQLLNPYRRLT